jgi:predicted permease
MSAPRLARLVLRLASPADRRDDTLGDLEEAHLRRTATGARLGPWLVTSTEAVVIAAALLWQRLPSAVPARGGLLSLGEVRLGLRHMRRQPVVTCTIGVALAIGIGLATLGFAMMEALLFSRLPFEGGDRFVVVRAIQEPGQDRARLTAADYAMLRAQASSLEHLGALDGGRENVTLPSGAFDTVTTAGITPSSLRFLPHGPIRGRLLTRADGEPGAAPVVMIGERFWRTALGAAEDAVGATIDMAGVKHVIVGVVPDGFQFPNEPALWRPIGEGFLDGRGALDPPGARVFGILGRGRSLAAARAQLAAISPQIPPPTGAEGPIRLEVTGYTDLGAMADTMAALAVGILLLLMTVIAANVANLVLARSFARSREFALRTALGASRRRLVGQVFVEVLLIGCVAAVLGSAAARAALRQFNGTDEIPFWVDFSGGPRTTILVVGATLLATAVAGAWPALRATRRDVVAGLQGGDGRTSDIRFGRTAGAMVVAQIALSVVMLHGALVVAQAFSQYANPPLPLPRNVLATSNVNQAEAGAGHLERVEQIALTLPGVYAAGLSTALPRHSPATLPIEVEAFPGVSADMPRPAPSAEVTRGFFDVLDGAPLSGRLFLPSDHLAGAPPVAIVNEPFVRRFMAGTSPIGRRIREIGDRGPGPWREVVGLVPDLGLSVGDAEFSAGYYTPLPMDTNSFVYLVVRGSADALSYVTPLRRALSEYRPGETVSRFERLEDVASEDRTFFAVFSAALVALGVVTLALALAGVYAMMSLIVTRRTREIGIRVALGAGAPRVIRAIVGRAAWQVGAGGVLGGALAILSLDARDVLVSRLGDGGPWTLPAVVLLLVVAGLAATWLPVRRALAVRPSDALRAE